MTPISSPSTSALRAFAQDDSDFVLRLGAPRSLRMTPISCPSTSALRAFAQDDSDFVLRLRRSAPSLRMTAILSFDFGAPRSLRMTAISCPSTSALRAFAQDDTKICRITRDGCERNAARRIHALASSTDCAESPCCSCCGTTCGRSRGCRHGRRSRFIPATGFVGVTLFFFLSGFVISYPFVAAEVAGKAAAVVATFRVAPLHQDRALIRALDRRCVRDRLRATAAWLGAAARHRHAPALHSHLVPGDVRQHQRRALDARGRSRVLLPLSTNLVGLSARSPG